MCSDIIWLDSVDSTNSEAKRRISELRDLSVIAARNQTAGRGQNGNKWVSESSKNLTISIVLKNPIIKPWEQSIISEATSQAIIDTLASYGIDARIKLPNDIYIGDRKICGILIENSILGEKINWSIIGIGLNVNQTEFPSDLPNPTSMSLCCPVPGEEYSIDEVLDRLVSRVALLIGRKNIHLHNAI